MGKLTNSLKATTRQLSDIKHGIRQMQELGQELSDNTLTVAEAGLRAGYAYAKAELEASNAQENEARPKPKQALPFTAIPLNADQLENSTQWTIESLKSRFGSYQAAYQYLKNTHRITVKQRGWQHILAVFNSGVGDKNKPLEQRVAQLEETVVLQRREIVVLETRLDQTIFQLQKLSAEVEKLAQAL